MGNWETLGLPRRKAISKTNMPSIRDRLETGELRSAVSLSAMMGNDVVGVGMRARMRALNKKRGAMMRSVGCMAVC